MCTGEDVAKVILVLGEHLQLFFKSIQNIPIFAPDKEILDLLKPPPPPPKKKNIILFLIKNYRYYP